MVAANDLGNFIDHIWYSTQINPAVFGPGATTANTNQRRVLFRQNPIDGQYYASVQEVRPDGSSRYNALMLQVQRRSAGGLSVEANYTFWRCETDRWNTSPGVDGLSIMVPDHPELAERRPRGVSGTCRSMPFKQFRTGTSKWRCPDPSGSVATG